MLMHALADKLRARGALGFAADAAIVLGQAALWGALIGAGAVTVIVVGLPLVAADKAIGWVAGERPARCDAGCAAHRDDCEGAS